MSQIKVELNSLIWVELTFKGYKDAMIFCVSIFIFCLEPTEREELRLPSLLWYFFSKVPLQNYLITAVFKVVSQQLQGI